MSTWVVTGAGGQLGSVVLRQLVERGANAIGLVSLTGVRPFDGRTMALDLCDAGALDRLMGELRPQHIVHAAALTSVARAHREPALAHAINVGVTAALARHARALGAQMAFTSTDMVFDGEHAPYAEDAAVCPVAVYGSTKAEAEQAALAEGASVFRMPLMYGLPASPRPGTFKQQIAALRAGSPLRLFHDEYRTPLWLDDGARAIIAAMERGLSDMGGGVFHLGGPERLSRVDMGLALARAVGVARPAIEQVSRMDADDAEPRPRDLSLSSERYARCVGPVGTPIGRPLSEALALMDLTGARRV